MRDKHEVSHISPLLGRRNVLAKGKTAGLAKSQQFEMNFS